jgi:hypothetical protein
VSVLTVLKEKANKFCLVVEAFFISPLLRNEGNVHIFYGFWDSAASFIMKIRLPTYRAVVRKTEPTGRQTLGYNLEEMVWVWNLVVIHGSFTLIGAELNDKHLAKCTYFKEADACASNRGVWYYIFNVCIESVRRIFLKMTFKYFREHSVLLLKINLPLQRKHNVTVFWNVTSCSYLGTYLRFRGIYWLRLQGKTVNLKSHNSKCFKTQFLLDL